MSALLFGSLGLVAQGALFNYFGSHAQAVLALLIFVPIAILPALYLPETARRDLDDISPEKTRNSG
jgi:ABC-type phosphate transport system permease subunit